jgi:CRP/FNR family transcriptional regulator, cyclic AMP receptor protein
MPVDFDLTKVSIFHKLTPEESDKLEAGILERAYEKGQMVFKQGDASESLYVVKSGEIEIFVTGENGEMILADFCDGNFFGELGLLDGEMRSAGARAVEDSVLLTLPRSVVIDFLHKNPAAALRILSVVTSRLRRADEMMTRLVTKNVNEVLDAKLTFGERLADRVASFGGSWTFIIIFGLVLFSWMAINAAYFLWKPFDPFPYIFLNLMLSCLAAIQAPVILMSQNRQGERDRLRAEMDFEVNLKAEIAIQQLHRKLDELREYQLRELEVYEQEQIRRLEDLTDWIKNHRV